MTTTGCSIDIIKYNVMKFFRVMHIQEILKRERIQGGNMEKETSELSIRSAQPIIYLFIVFF